MGELTTAKLELKMYNVMNESHGCWDKYLQFMYNYPTYKKLNDAFD